MRYECVNYPYTLNDTISGCDVLDEYGGFVCELPYGTSHFENEDGTLDEDAIDFAVREQTDTVETIEYFQQYC